MPELDNPKRERFCQEYIRDLNGAQAAIRAGYSAAAAKEQASRLLTFANVAERINELKKERTERCGMKADDVVIRLKELTCREMGEYVEWGPNGVELKPSTELTLEQRAAVAEVSQTISDKGGSVKFKLHSQPQSLRLLAEHLGILNAPKQEHDHTHYFANMPEEKRPEDWESKYGGDG